MARYETRLFSCATSSTEVVEGIAVDTHVLRVAKRLGFTRHDDAVNVEKDLMALLPRKEWCMFTYRIIDHGRAICKAPTPTCDVCPLRRLCPSSRAR